MENGNDDGKRMKENEPRDAEKRLICRVYLFSSIGKAGDKNVYLSNNHKNKIDMAKTFCLIRKHRNDFILAEKEEKI